MATHKVNKQPWPPMSESGLVFKDHGLQGLVVQTTPNILHGIERHSRVIKFLDTNKNGPPGGILLLQLATDSMVLSRAGLYAATSAQASVYVSSEVTYLEWPMANGWRDRREVSPRIAESIQKNKGAMVTEADRRWAADVLHQLHPERAHYDPLAGFIADACAWWFARVSGPIFGHATGFRPFQLLKRSAIARRASGKPQKWSKATSDGPASEALAIIQTIRVHTNETSTFDNLIVFSGQIARGKGSKVDGRRQIVDHINRLIPIAAGEGRVQVIALGAIRHAIEAGGARGRLWAPITIYEYTRQGLKELVLALLKSNMDQLDGVAWVGIYTQILGKITDSQRGKFAAFLEVFHRYLVIAGFDSLNRRLSEKSVLLPPAASVVWPHELKLALQYVSKRAPTDRVRLQATLCLQLGYSIPLRSVELWCIRIQDVHVLDQMYLVIYPRLRDGVGKVPSLRRQEEIDGVELKASLIDMVLLRRADAAADDDVLLGQPTQPDGRHEEILTTNLMNEALKWATGDHTASFYDLRHTVFSRRANAVFLDLAQGVDASALRQLSAQGGHVGPSSTADYVHWLERSISSQARAARPKAWLPTQTNANFAFEDVGKGLTSELAALVDVAFVNSQPVDSKPLAVGQRSDLAWYVAKNLNLQSIAGCCMVTVETVDQVIQEFL